MFDLKGKAVLVTGGSSGIGAEVAEGFGKCGSRVAVHYRGNQGAAEEVAARVRAAGGEAIVVQGDVTSIPDLQRFVEEAVQALGGLDVVIHNAGDVLKRGEIDQAPDEEIDAIMDLNARAVVTVVRATLPHLRKSKGNLVATTSVAGRQAGGPGTAVYSASKAFAEGIVHFMARDLAPQGVRFNAVAPGLILTPLQDRNTTPDQLKLMQTRIPLGRAGVPADLVGAYLLLASNTLSGFTTGATIDVNGGQYLA